ncbi:hypothetical protein F2Q70_00034718 [Brassica cretica]|uniref:Myb-like domain-containing protein n=1 Tax=Brassica cretica TaxID=69181 RepID=A0A8S9JQH6_BRACR|nr:hypothetical protein F2Q70_00034718 [Brassica cretica]
MDYSENKIWSEVKQNERVLGFEHQPQIPVTRELSGEKLEESVIIFEADNGGDKKSKKKRGDEKALLNTDDDAKGETGKRKRDDDCDLGAEEKSKKKKKKKLIVVSENYSFSSSKKKRKKPSELFTKEEDELIKKGVLEYVEANFLGDHGINMVMNCRSHPQVKGCWKEITQALPWRPHCGVYKRAHTLFVWSKEDLELVLEYQKKHGNNWKTLADKMAQETRSQHGMLRDNIPWTAISDQLGTRDHTVCCQKWYHQLTSSMVSKGLWANVDDYRLLDELVNLDAACVDDVDWDYLLDNRDGDACRSRWNQMVRHIGLPGTKTFAEHVEVLSQRYCPHIAEDREDFDNRPFDP